MWHQSEYGYGVGLAEFAVKIKTAEDSADLTIINALVELVVE